MFIRLSQNTVGLAFERMFVVISTPTDVAGLQEPHEGASRNRSRPTPLQKWRMKAVVDYVDSHLSSRITLATMAAAAGLSCMHFAAQFRAATGTRPHDYVLRRRIERAQALLRDSEIVLVDIALSVGFQSQSHFTTVFKRFVGETPHRWRELTRNDHALENAT
jgi:AraC-like DNA-binding protein